VSTTSETQNDPAELEQDPFLRLHKMSTTAGLGSGDYVAINSTALAALLLGIASCLVLWGNLLFLVIPAVSILCAFLAFRQISASNGTQTGKGLAALGLLLSLGMGGGFAGQSILENIHSASEEHDVIALLQQFGNDIRDSKYEEAYGLCDDRFHTRVAKPLFIETWKLANGSSIRGGITGVTWNGLLKFENDPLTGERAASGIILISFEKIPARERQTVVFYRIGDNWRIDQMPDMFPTETSSLPGHSSPGKPTGPIAPLGPPVPGKSN
jgi:hypothetical protein